MPINTPKMAKSHRLRPVNAAKSEQEHRRDDDQIDALAHQEPALLYPERIKSCDPRRQQSDTWSRQPSPK